MGLNIAHRTRACADFGHNALALSCGKARRACAGIETGRRRPLLGGVGLKRVSTNAILHLRCVSEEKTAHARQHPKRRLQGHEAPGGKTKGAKNSGAENPEAVAETDGKELAGCWGRTVIVALQAGGITPPEKDDVSAAAIALRTLFHRRSLRRHGLILNGSP